MTLTVLGSSGFIGSSVAAFLRQRGEQCFTPTREELDSLRGRHLGHVIYCIGVTADFRTRPYDTVTAHVSRLLDVLRSYDCDSVLYLSSTRVYGSAGRGRESENAFRVNPASADDLYNISKLMGESICLSIDNPNVRVARLSNVYGHDWTSQNFLSSVLRSAAGGPVTFQTAPESAKDYIAIEDVVQLLVAIASGGRERLYNVASGVQVSNAEIADVLRNCGCAVAFDAPAPIVTYPSIDTTRIREELGFRPRSLIEDLPSLLEECRHWSVNDSHRS